MAKPITPLIGCDVFVLNEKSQVLLIQRADNGCWALPGGCHDLKETPKECAERECFEESGFRVRATELLGVFSSNRYTYLNYPWTENEFCHILFKAEIISGKATISSETTNVEWFSESEIPELTDGHDVRIKLGFKALHEPNRKPYFE